MRKRLPAALVAAGALTLAACGEGGDSTDTTVATTEAASDDEVSEDEMSEADGTVVDVAVVIATSCPPSPAGRCEWPSPVSEAAHREPIRSPQVLGDRRRVSTHHRGVGTNSRTKSGEGITARCVVRCRRFRIAHRRRYRTGSDPVMVGGAERIALDCSE